MEPTAATHFQDTTCSPANPMIPEDHAARGVPISNCLASHWPRPTSTTTMPPTLTIRVIDQRRFNPACRPPRATSASATPPGSWKTRRRSRLERKKKERQSGAQELKTEAEKKPWSLRPSRLSLRSLRSKMFLATLRETSEGNSCHSKPRS